MYSEQPTWNAGPPKPRPGRGVAAKIGLLGAGVIAGAVIATTFGANAATPSSTPSSPASSTSTGSGTFHSNEDPAHEQGESAAREAQEDAGQRPTVP
jgi:hypothetical protein